MVYSKKSLVLLSGGLDSILTVKLLEEQGIEATGLVYESCFFNAKAARKAASSLKIPLKIVDISQEHLEMVKIPPHGYGKAANPCLDCHTLMLKKAKELMVKEGYDFIATGEVLGERPFSQNYKALLKIQELSGLGDRLIRPLSAKLLPPTLPEKKGWVNRSQMGDIQGRTRQRQLALAKKFKIIDYPQPAGGCILCERLYAQKLFTMFQKWPKCKVGDVSLLSMGRVFWEENYLIIIGRNQEENQDLKKIAQKEDILIDPKNFTGPTALIRGERKKKIPDAVIKKSKKLIQKYTKKPSPSFFYNIIRVS